ncbi:hypothetical protein OS493_013065 [Desmophyllum pertusum]|uniref:Uncharacterized protein n=1 Tax=Desmophyllum pertusum TaxID=174260 RepID=A0A9W9YQ08_9CNID|nr:hypothetical protein OS493_013065 [Desmophyllum pertusum]
MSMLLLPEKKFCYLLPLQDELLTPRKLINGLDTAERTVSKTSETKSVGSKWIVDKEMTDRSVLSDELATFCAKIPDLLREKDEGVLWYRQGSKLARQRFENADNSGMGYISDDGPVPDRRQ